jgi:hypothetical protein
MGVFGFSCLGVLVVITAVDNKNALATVALALAILAFSIQLIIFVAQQNLATEQGRRNEELYGSMQGVLAEIREKAAGTQADVRTINEKMLGAILSKNLASAPGGQVDFEEVASQLARAASDGDSRSGEEPSSPPIWPDRRPTPDDPARVRTLQSYPAEDRVGDAMTVLSELSRADREGLKSFGDDEIIALQPDFPFDPSLTEASVGDLENLGLVEPYPAERQPDGAWTRVFHLTDRGREIARLLTARGDPPPYLVGLRDIRDSTPDRLEWQGGWRTDDQD